MPRIELISVPLFNPNDPYHFEYDNLPLKNLMRRQNLINMALDDLIEQERDAIGTQGTVANRLNQSINQDGSLKVAAIDETLHSMGAHTDDLFGDDEEYDEWVAERAAPFVRMEKAEADKLLLIADEATNFGVEVQTGDEDEISDFTEGLLRFIPSTTVTWDIVSPNKIRAHLGFPLAAAHRHYYDQTPIQDDDDATLYEVNVTATPYVEESLRVYVNGMRLTASASIYVPGALVNDPWTLLTYTPDHENGTFTLSTSLAEEDVLRIDYDISFVEE